MMHPSIGDTNPVMPVLTNAKHERFAQGVASGLTIDEAYQRAGYQQNRGNATRLNANESVTLRIEEILRKSAAHVEVTQAQVLAELAKIGFADIRKAVRWNGSHVTEEDNPDGGDVLIIKETRNNLVALVDSDDLDEATAAAIAEISQNASGGIKIKFHDKRAALVDIGRHLGMFKDKIELSGKITLEDLVLRSLPAEASKGKDDAVE